MSFVLLVRSLQTAIFAYVHFCWAIKDIIAPQENDTMITLIGSDWKKIQSCDVMKHNQYSHHIYKKLAFYSEHGVGLRQRRWDEMK